MKKWGLTCQRLRWRAEPEESSLQRGRSRRKSEIKLRQKVLEVQRELEASRICLE
eukprot:08079.XXX_131235_131399_1 [CDS] Oithona nana genome sequencing.